MTAQRGATVAGAAASIAVAFAVVLATAYGLTILEQRLEDDSARTALHAVLGVRTAHAAEPSAPLLIRSHSMPITVPAGSPVMITLGFKNESGRSWVRGAGSTAILERATPNGPSVFMATTWVDTMRATFQRESDIPPGTLALFSAEFRAPIDPGTYTDQFILRSLEGTTYAGSETEVTIISVEDASQQPQAASSTNVSVYGVPSSAFGSDGTDPNFIPFTQRYPEAPLMRVGIAYHEPEDAGWTPHQITSPGPFRVTTEDGHEVLRVPGGSAVSIDYRPGTSTYHLKHGMEWYTLNQPVRFTPERADDLLELSSYTKKLHWEGNTEDNLFRGTLEIRYVPDTERLWAINELSLEEYLKGLVETSDGAPAEFHKAQVIAARSFALYHIERGGKYKKGQFILTGSASDQVYRGAKAAARRPNLVAAVEATRGIVVTYDGDVVVTPYYAQSDGRTRTWEQVWGGQPKAWLASMSDPVCEGKRKIGHGVGMPQRCAMTLAEQGWTFQSIL
ncbi:MAG: SpoIID/LytB domain-containing protein, partial [bacterium]|nr:SpoIID/LytB domain-containing protein [bacterium]